MPHDAVILAAGGSRRLGRPKQLLTRDGETLVARVARLVLATAPERTIVVVGAHGNEVVAALAGFDVQFVLNDLWPTGMASSLRLAATELAGRERATLVCVVDQPALETRHLDALIAAHREDRDTVTAYGDAAGVPVMLRASTLSRAIELEGDAGFRALWRGTAPRTVHADELGEDLDDETDLRRAVAAGLLDDSAGDADRRFLRSRPGQPPGI
ncbi:nucleotidyltransferase family protein [Luteibacter yeojuensis]|uniref:Nucleotidyltransferase family protein n=2 Tax=Luteibacter yeojuensis TaxID=345309 RepID=A0A7X5QWY8_9GAMM|nr:nucleotidyltransferase family protein [Luteibacter yeojuensis]